MHVCHPGGYAGGNLRKKSLIDSLIASDLADDPDPETIFMWDLIMTAKWMGIDPEVLAEKSYFWFDWGLACMQADEANQRERQRRSTVQMSQ